MLRDALSLWEGMVEGCQAGGVVASLKEDEALCQEKGMVLKGAFLNR